MSTLFKHRAPKDGALFSIFIGGVRRSELVKLSDEELKKIVTDEVSQLLGCDAQPDMIKIGRHNQAIPQYYTDSNTHLRYYSQKGIQDLSIFIKNVYLLLVNNDIYN